MFEFKDYNRKVKKPMSFKVIGQNIQMAKYSGFNDFALDVKQIYLNARTYNGPKHMVTMLARNMVKKAIEWARHVRDFVGAC